MTCGWSGSCVPAIACASSPSTPVAMRRIHPCWHDCRRESGMQRSAYVVAAEDNVLVEFGAPVLDLELRFQVQALLDTLRARAIPGMLDLTPGIRSLQLHFDPARLSQARRARRGARSAGRAARCRADADPEPHRAPAAVLGRSGDAARNPALHAVGARGCALVSGQHRVHPSPSTGLNHATTCIASCSRRATS